MLSVQLSPEWISPGARVRPRIWQRGSPSRTRPSRRQSSQRAGAEAYDLTEFLEQDPTSQGFWNPPCNGARSRYTHVDTHTCLHIYISPTSESAPTAGAVRRRVASSFTWDAPNQPKPIWAGRRKTRQCDCVRKVHAQRDTKKQHQKQGDEHHSQPN